MASVLLVSSVVTLRIERFEDKGFVIFFLVGRIEELHVPDLQELLESEARAATLALDLREVRLVDRQVVKFLAACETKGIQLRNCPSFVRKWIEIGAGTIDSSDSR